MHPSDSFLHKLRKIRKQLAENPAGAEESVQHLVREAFHSSVPALPNTLVDELFEHFNRRLTAATGTPHAVAGRDADSGSRQEHNSHEELDRLEPLADVVDLLSEDYDENSDPLQAEDWKAIRDIFSDYAAELDMRTVNYVMRLVVDHGAVQ